MGALMDAFFGIEGRWSDDIISDRPIKSFDQRDLVPRDACVRPTGWTGRRGYHWTCGKCGNEWRVVYISYCYISGPMFFQPVHGTGRCIRK